MKPAAGGARAPSRPCSTTLVQRKDNMKTWIKRTLIGALGVTLLIGGLAAYGKRSGYWHGGHGPMSEERVVELRGKAVERISDKMVLDAAQKAKLELLADEVVAQRKSWRSSGDDARAEAGRIIASSSFDRSKAQQMFEQKSGWAQVAGPKLITTMADFYDSLNPQQQQMMRERLERLDRRGNHRRDD